MAALQKIRSKGALLLIVVGLALFAFIAEEFVRSLSTSKNESRQRVGEVCGKSIDIQEFNQLVEEYTDVIKFTNGLENLTEEQAQSVRDQVWQNFVQNAVLENECEELGLTVTDAEMQEIIKSGNSPLLQQTPFTNQQGGFDQAALNQFLTNYKVMQSQPSQNPDAYAYYTQIYNYWLFIEKNLRQQTLAAKYQVLLNNSFISNPVSAKAAFNATHNKKDVLVAALPFTSINDADITVEEADLKAKYEEYKPAFVMDEATRDIKYIDVNIVASQADRDQIHGEMLEAAASLNAGGADIANIVRKSGSSVSYSTLPIRKESLPSDIAGRLDSMVVGAQVGPYVNAGDNTENIIRLMATTTVPDSVQFCQIGVAGEDAAAQQKADSIMKALQSEPFDSVASHLGQNGAANWLTSAQFEGSVIDENNRKYISAVLSQTTGTTQQVKVGGNIIIVKVMDRRNFVQKYDVAVIKRSIDFSNETFNKIYNDFSQFVAANRTLEEIEANAATAGYMVQTRQSMYASEHNVAGVSGTREAMRWAFNEDTEVGSVSDIYTCGNNDHLLVLAVTEVNDGKYRTLESVKTFLESEVKNDKKATILKEKMATCTSVAEVAKIQGAVQDTVRQSTFAYPASVMAIGASEPALSGAIAKTEKGNFVQGVKGNSGVYAFQVLNAEKAPEMNDTDKEVAASQLVSQQMRAASRFMGDLFQKAKITDNRYLFY